MTPLINKITLGILYPLIGLMSSVAVVVFIWGIISYIANADNEEARATGKKRIIWGLVGLFIMACVIGIINFIQKLVGY